MAFRVQKTTAALCLLTCVSCQTYAETSVTVSAYNDYLFNGVSQTNKDPALQIGVDWRAANGFYLGAWGSNVDFAGTDIEADASAGYSANITDKLSYDVGISQYTYHGTHNSNDSNYAEAHANITYQNTSLTTWYAWDYFGTGARHYIVKLAQTVPVTDKAALLLAVDRSASLDQDKWAWEGHAGYLHWQVEGDYDLNGYQLSLGLHGTTLNHSGDTRLLFGVSKSWGF